MKHKTIENLLLFGSIGGFIGTCVTIAKDAPKAEQKLRERQNEEFTLIDKIKIVVPECIPSIIVGSITLGCIIGSHVNNKKQLASMAAAVGASSKYISKYKDKIKDMYGEKVEQTIHEEVVKECDIKGSEDRHLYEWMGSIYSNDIPFKKTEPILFYDEFSDRYFEKSMEDILLAEYHLNREYIMSGTCTLNDWYECIGLAPLEGADNCLWEPMNELYYWINFNHYKTKSKDGRECCVIEFVNEPYVLDEEMEEFLAYTKNEKESQ